MPQLTGKNNRITWIDCTKGIAILLVILGHSMTDASDLSIWTRGLIFSFHMPLFFILSCMTFRTSEKEEQFLSKTRRAFRHLIVPALITYLLLTLYQIKKDPSLLGNLDFWQMRLYTLIFSSGVTTSFSSLELPEMGMAWFFFALFIGRSLFDLLHMKLARGQVILTCCLLSLLGIILGHVQWLPFSLDVVLTIMPFFCLGFYYKKSSLEEQPFKKLLIFLAIWFLLFWLCFPDIETRSYFELSCRRYPLYPICLISAAAGTFFFCEIGILLTRGNILPRPLLYIGKNSLYLLCIHILDTVWRRFWFVENQDFVSAFRRILLDLVVFVVFLLLRRIFFMMRTRLQAENP